MKQDKINGRLAFTPSEQGRLYFDNLIKRMTAARRLGVHVTQREAFDRMVDLARAGEVIVKERGIKGAKELQRMLELELPH